MQRVWVQSLVGALRSLHVRGQGQKVKKKKKLQWKIITLTEGGLFPFNRSFIFGVVCQHSSGKLKSTGLRPPCYTQDAPLHPRCHTVSSIPCPACEAMPLSLGLWRSGCSRSQRASTPYKRLLGWPTDLDSPLRILTPTVSAAKLHVARMISPAKGSRNQSISQSGHWSQWGDTHPRHVWDGPPSPSALLCRQEIWVSAWRRGLSKREFGAQVGLQTDIQFKAHFREGSYQFHHSYSFMLRS